MTATPGNGGVIQTQPDAARRTWRQAAAAALIVLSAVVACNKIRNYDTFWHLKSGQWMIEHHRVLGHDPFGVPDAPGDQGRRKWVNVHWAFQVIVTAVHYIGGFSALVLFKMAVFAGTMAVFAAWLRRRTAPALLMLSGLAIIIGIEGRVRVRPEIITFLLFVTTLVLVESVRQGASVKRLWWLVPINIVWVNMHGLFVVGVVTAWAAVLGAFIDRALRRETTGALATGKALLPVIVATAACLVSPWPVEAVLHPLLLRTRITGEQSMYTFGVSEFRSTYRANIFTSVSMMTALALALAALEAMRARRRSVPIGHVFWYVGFLALGVLAVRNVPLFVIPAGFLLAVHGGQWIDQVVRRRPAWRKVGPAASTAMLLLLAATAAGYATETVYHWQRRQARFGLGLTDGNYPVDMAKWLGESELTGDILALNFGDGGTFIYYSYPRRKVWMDGRLEVHSARRFERLYEYCARMLSPQQAAETPLPPSVRFIVVRFEDTKHIEALSNCSRFKLLYVDRAGVCFARIPLRGEKNAQLLRKWHQAEPLPAANLDRFDLPLKPGGDALLNVETAATWYRRNVPPAHWNMGAVFFSIGVDDMTIRHLAIRYLTVAEKLGFQEPVSRVGLLAEAHRRVSEVQPIEPETNLPTDPNLSRALALFGKFDLANLEKKRNREYALVHVKILKQARQIDAAAKAIKQYLQNLPIPRRWRPATVDLQFRDSIQTACYMAQVTARQFDSPDLLPSERALLLLRKDVGLIDRAVAVLRSAADPPRQGRLLLGDLFLRKGLTRQARQTYESVAGQDKWDVQMRFGLCGWAEGDFAAAEARLGAAARAAPSRPEPVVYLAMLYEQLGDYQAAAEILDSRPAPPTQPAGNQADRLLRQIRARLMVRRH